jgi:LPXTG-motif cell wall-anchored protein
LERRAEASDAGRDPRVSYAAVRQSTAARPIAPRGSVAPSQVAQNGAVLPKTATDAELKLWFGLLACLVSLLLFMFGWRRRTAGGVAG